MNQGMLALKLGPVDLQSLIRIDERFYLKMAHDKGLQMTITIPENLPLVYADGNRLRQVINNLLDNAINYTHRGQVTLSSKQSRNHLEIEITDTGVGIPEAAFPKLFDPFQQADTHMSEGSGLGLALTKKLVELQGGKMWFESEVGVGSTFHFTLPLFNQTPAGAANAVLNQRTYAIAHDAELTLATPYYSQVADASQILVVGNDLDNLKVLIDMLEGVSYAVIAVKDGGDALSEIHRSKPDLVVLDLMKDGLPGFTICQMIREQYSLTELPILMLTTSSINKDIHYAFRSGANDVLERPYNFAEFSARIRGLIMMKVAAAQATNMEVAFLQSQIRPHFLYNVLNSIIALSYENVEHAREMIAQFATYLRSSFDFQNTSAISSLKKELTLVNAYLSIEKTRFQDRIQVSINADPQLDFPLPPLMIQPLIENAVQHGIVKQKKGGKVHLSVLTEKDAYVITVSDNGKGMDEEQIRFALNKERGRSVGLKNINSRLKHFYNTELKIKSVLGKGSYFSMRIPKK
jgi:sensor histidine kinase YesM